VNQRPQAIVCPPQVQEELLLGILEIIDASGTSVAVPWRTPSLDDVAVSLPARSTRSGPS